MFDRKKKYPWINLVLLLCYVIFPVVQYVAIFLEIDLFRNWIDVVWLMLLVGCLLTNKLSKTFTQCVSRNFAILSCVAMLLLFDSYIFDIIPFQIFLMEAKPFFYVLTAVIAVRTLGLPTPTVFCKYGLILSLILLIEFVIGTIINGALYRPFGSGEVNYDAALLLLSLIFSLSSVGLYRKYFLWIVIGLLLTMSRTSIFAACLICLFSKKIKLYYKIFIVLLSFMMLLASFLSRDLPLTSIEQMDRYWMWRSGFEYIFDNIGGTSLIIPPGGALAVEMPYNLSWLWNHQQETLGLNELYAYNFHSAWLRLALVWGWLPVIGLMVWVIKMVYFSCSEGAISKFYVTTCILLGITMGLFYLSNVSLPYIIAGIFIFNKLQFTSTIHTNKC